MMTQQIDVQGDVTRALVSDPSEREKQLARRAAEYIIPQVWDMAEPHPRVRPDIGGCVQIDFGHLPVGATRHDPYMVVTFVTSAEREVTFNIDLEAFAKAPAPYTEDLLDNLKELLPLTLQRRAKRQLEAHRMYRIMGGSHG